jgi:hypothetical protein
MFFTVPFERDSKFIGREDVITDIDKKFEVQRQVAPAGIRLPFNTTIDSEVSIARALSFIYMLTLSQDGSQQGYCKEAPSGRLE